ncbi:MULTISPECIES: hypothetical protein [unclassified Rhizobium]|uniref:hypothetical protein n=1 Tax=unclassified Rhizobium TaxID=2613769 RepID=UPI0007EAF108|nr:MULTISPECIES: hypothetical protein [unclassified Rhizobium]ANL12009.1 hypothetical protein AMJ98_PA00063 [Rhizobium sp. N1341]ANM42854.1 hypothetical protein AMK03_PA00063 [Rhizobium sp. N741]
MTKSENLISIEEAAKLLGIDKLHLRRLVDVANVVPSVIRLHDGELWHEDTQILFSESDLASFASEILRQRFTALKVAHSPVIAPDASFAFSAGWTGLLDEMAADLVRLDGSARIMGGKEKLGSMIVFIDRDPAKTKAVSALKEDYRRRSLDVCDECGAPGRLRMGVSIAKTTCDRHAHLAAPFREDDGEIVDLPPTGGPIYKDGRQGTYGVDR